MKAKIDGDKMLYRFTDELRNSWKRICGSISITPEERDRVKLMLDVGWYNNRDRYILNKIRERYIDKMNKIKKWQEIADSL